MGQGSLTLSFPELPAGNIYLALSGGVESTILLHLLLEQYPSRKVIPCTYRPPDRRQWEFTNALKISQLFGIGDLHVETSPIRKHKPFTTVGEYFNNENRLFDLVRMHDRKYVAGFTGKNTTTLDPEIITPKEQLSYLKQERIYRPFLTFNKVDTVNLFYQYDCVYLLSHTHSCQTRGDIHCGQCHACWERIDAFTQLGKKDPAIYADDYEFLVKQVSKYFKTRWPRS